MKPMGTMKIIPRGSYRFIISLFFWDRDKWSTQNTYQVHTRCGRTCREYPIWWGLRPSGPSVCEEADVFCYCTL